MSVPSPAAALTAEQLLARIKEMGGRVYGTRAQTVFVLTDDETLALWLLDLGGRAHQPKGSNDLGIVTVAPGAYRRTREKDAKIEWDIWIHAIPVNGKTAWEAIHDADA